MNGLNTITHTQSTKSMVCDVANYDAVAHYLRVSHGIELMRHSHQHMLNAGLDLSEVTYFAVQEYYGRKIKDQSDIAVREKIYREAYSKFTYLQVQKGSVDQGVNQSVVALARPLVEGLDLLEVGCGNGGFAHQVIDVVRSYSFIEPSPEAAEFLIARIKTVKLPKHAIIGTAREIANLDDNFDVIYCNDVYEHLHPDDAECLVEACAQKLRPSGRLIMIASNRHFGPFDGTERYLGKGAIAAGLHINETSYQEVVGICLKHGFSKVSSPPMPMSVYARLPVLLRRFVPWPCMVDARLKVLIESRWRFLAPYMSSTSVVIVAER